MDKLDYEKIMKYFPPVNPNIDDIYSEAENTYTSHNSISPLKPISIKGDIYSPDILSNLKLLRILLNSNISTENFIYELNKLLEAWGPGGIYGSNILNSNFIDLINKINLKYNKQLELIKDAQEMVLEHQMKELEKDIKDVSFKHKKYRTSDLDKLSNLSLKSKISKRDNISKIKKSNKK